MKKRLMLIIIMAIPNILILASEDENPTVKAQSGWGDWLGKKATATWQAVRQAPRTLWNESKTQVVDPNSPTRQAVSAFGEGMALMPGATAVDKLRGVQSRIQHYFKVDRDNTSLWNLFLQIEKDQEKILKTSFYLSGGVALAIFGIAKVIAYYKNKNSDKTSAVNNIKDLLLVALADSIAYPTRSSKLHALMKKNEFLIPGVTADEIDVDGIFNKACSEVSRVIVGLPYSEEQKGMDREIGKHISQLNEQLHDFSTLQKKIDFINRQSLGDRGLASALTLDQLNTYMKDPKVRAYWSVYSRLNMQIVFEDALSEESRAILAEERQDIPTRGQSEEYKKRQQGWVAIKQAALQKRLAENAENEKEILEQDAIAVPE